MRHPVSTIVSLFFVHLLITTTTAANPPTSYCKCICFQNSTIIPLNSPPDTPKPGVSTTTSPHLAREAVEHENERDQKHRTMTCNDCNRAFCLDYNLPICKNAKEEDVFATCFQRDSVKDRTIVTIFIAATASLLGWALVKPFVMKSGVSDVMQRYTSTDVRTQDTLPVSSDADEDGQPSLGSHAAPSGRLERGGAGGRGSISRQGGLNS